MVLLLHSLRIHIPVGAICFEFAVALHQLALLSALDLVDYAPVAEQEEEYAEGSDIRW